MNATPKFSEMQKVITCVPIYGSELMGFVIASKFHEGRWIVIVPKMSVAGASAGHFLGDGLLLDGEHGGEVGLGQKSLRSDAKGCTNTKGRHLDFSCL
jgi:hypothetical protein